MKVVGGFVRFDGARKGQYAHEWGISEDGKMPPLSNRAHTVQFSEGYALSKAPKGRAYATSYLVLDPSNCDALTVVGAEIVYDNQTSMQRRCIQFGETGTHRFQVFDAFGWSDELGQMYQNVFLRLRLAAKDDPDLCLEKFATNESSSKPLCQMFEYSSSCFGANRGQLIAKLGTCGRHTDFGGWRSGGERKCTIYTLIWLCRTTPARVRADITTRNGIVPFAALALAVPLAFLAPVAVTSVIGAMGFEAGGIVAGSTAAGMMSAEAIASGGAIAAGGTVATLQSIGAVGLSAGGAAACASAGAVLGGAVGSGTAVVGGRIQSCFRPSTHFQDPSLGIWSVVTSQHGDRRVYEFIAEDHARQFFQNMWSCTRILVNPDNEEVASAVVVCDATNALRKIREAWVSFFLQSMLGKRHSSGNTGHFWRFP